MPLFKNFGDAVAKMRTAGKVRFVYAYPNDKDAFETIEQINRMDLGEWILVGDKARIQEIAAGRNAASSGYQTIDLPDPFEAAREAAGLAAAERGGILIKGDMNSSDFMRAVLDSSSGMRTGRLLSHLSAFEIPGFDRLIFMTDGGLNIAPTLDEKRQIIQNAIDYLVKIGYSEPKVAILAANEAISPKMPVTVEAAQLKEMAARGEITGGAVDGPMALDIALDAGAAAHKCVSGPVAGRADLLVVPTIEAGNIFGKSITYCARGVMAGIILGAKIPIILTSRVSSPESKIASIALAVLCVNGRDI